MSGTMAQWRRLRQIYTMLANLKDPDLNMTTYNLLVDIKKVVDKLVETAKEFHG